jgi:hypothetical protein
MKRSAIPTSPTVELKVPNLESYYRVTPEALNQYVRTATIATPQEFLDPDEADRYVVISVDPAAGGTLSEEAMVVFLLCGSKCALLTGRKHHFLSLFPVSGDSLPFTDIEPSIHSPPSLWCSFAHCSTPSGH